MKLLSTTRNSDGKQLICKDAVFDPNLITIAQIDNKEKVIAFQYDFSECGHPLNLPIETRSVEFILKLTRHNIHICAIAELNDDASDEFAEFIGDLGEIEFDVRMTTAEKFMLILSILFTLLNKTEMKAKENGIDKESNNIVEKLKKEYFCDEKTIMSTIKDLFTNIFNDDNIKG